MQESLKSGATGTRTVKVDRARTVAFGDPQSGGSARVYATPALVEDIEVTCRELILGHADPGEDSVGVRVDITHKAPTLEGQDVTISATVSKVAGRAVSFDVTASDGIDEICTCTHDRFVVDVSVMFQRLAAKREKISG